MNNAHNKKDRTLFVSMIHESVTDDDLYELLSQVSRLRSSVDLLLCTTSALLSAMCSSRWRIYANSLHSER
ncbi:unnamed protein product [Heligmosomoides polygyrus]|uniref:F-box domain-containing protein n=1 Tax=Heligmosomoides polygyrus TaxID=6339 RepID=A0A183GX90_HELPZ|nr:unnamed protein product [Heligmosomoides polygyrus]